jgi:predicted AlkP superfamily phosphohydrolase/phosphomutase
VVVIGLDAAEPALIRAWVEAGELPVIAGLMAGGRSWRLSSPAWMSTGPIWPCFYAGTSPARHGRFFFRQLESGTYRIVKKRADAINATPFWDLAAVVRAERPPGASDRVGWCPSRTQLR